MTIRRHVFLLLAVVAGCGGPEEVSPPPRTAPAPGTVDERPPPEPVVGYGDGPSCEAGRQQWLGDHSASFQEPPEELVNAIKEQLNRGTYLNDCEVAPSSSVEICAAIAGGEALGVTVTLAPGEQGQADCVAGQIRRMEFSEHDDIAVATTTFEPSL